MRTVLRTVYAAYTADGVFLSGGGEVNPLPFFRSHGYLGLHLRLLLV